MSENDRISDGPAGRPKVKVTDRRRVREEEAAPTTTPSIPSDTPGSGDRPSIPEPELAAARKEAAEYRDHLMRLQAEFDNYRKRVMREQTELAEMGAMPVARRLLEVLDDFELALISAEDQPDFERFLKGIELVYAKLIDALKAEGLERMQPEGEPFDPELHEALLQTGEGEGDPFVADVLRPGYTLRGRVLRHAGVRVERGD
jgi:molecular chaperone GrpE